VKGIVFNLLEEVVRNEYDEDAWEEILDAAATEGAYTSLGSYPDDELGRLVHAASARLGIPADGVVRWFGRKALPLLAEKYADFFQPHSSTLPFLLTLNDVIHAEVRKIYPGADVPEFDFHLLEDDVLLLGYESPRNLCALAEGFVEGAAIYYDEEVSVQHEHCRGRGDTKCSLRVSLKSKVPSS
jgi:hypothetical protein